MKFFKILKNFADIEKEVKRTSKEVLHTPEDKRPQEIQETVQMLNALWYLGLLIIYSSICFLINIWRYMIYIIKR